MQNIETAPRKPRHEIVRILMFLGISLGVQVVASLAGVLLSAVGFVFIAGLFPTVDSFGALGVMLILMRLIVGPAAAAACNRILTFRAEEKWWLGPLLVLGLTFLYVHLTPRVSWTAVALWLISQYVLQRFVLYRKTLDTLP